MIDQGYMWFKWSIVPDLFVSVTTPQVFPIQCWVNNFLGGDNDPGKYISIEKFCAQLELIPISDS